jgi:RNA polymerase sigma-70 factor (ECF subfamily)
LDDQSLQQAEHAGPSPEDQVGRAEQERHLHDALLQLDEAHRSVIDLAYFEGLSHAAIAHKLQMPLGTVKTRLRNAVMRLRDRLIKAD